MNWNDKTAANVRAIKPSGIRKFFDIAAQVEGVLSLSIGEPDFAAPDKVIDAMKAQPRCERNELYRQLGHDGTA